MQQELLPHLFRTEYRKIVSVLCKHFGFERMEVAEDMASETFLAAAEIWPLKGIPPNPTAWLYNVAKNKASNYAQRAALFENKISKALREEKSVASEIDLSPQNISDSQLQMMFAICYPSIPVEAQIGLSLRILCGFGIEEIADAFLTNKETINKRLMRAKEKLREEKIKIEIPEAAAIPSRLDAVLTTIYLLFSEGYYSESQNKVIRKDLCDEAMRLCTMLIDNVITNAPAANALMALMCFQSSRFDARVNDSGEQILYQEQDITRWDAGLIRKGEHFLNASATGNNLSRYHLEAAIAYWHTHAEDTPEKWENILQLYNKLLQLQYSPIAALNRTYALAKANGKEVAIKEAQKLKLTGNHFYYALLGELYTGVDEEKSRENFLKALSLAKTDFDKATLRKKLQH